MSQENVEIVRSIYAAWERGDFSATEWLHPEIEFAMVGGPSPGTWTGLAGMAEGTHEFHRGRGKTSGLELGQMQTKNAALFHVRDGKVTRFVAYWDRERHSPTWACRSKTLPPTPEPAGYCAGDVAGERGDRAGGLRAVE